MLAKNFLQHLLTLYNEIVNHYNICNDDDEIYKSDTELEMQAVPYNIEQYNIAKKANNSIKKLLSYANQVHQIFIDCKKIKVKRAIKFFFDALLILNNEIEKYCNVLLQPEIPLELHPELQLVQLQSFVELQQHQQLLAMFNC